MTPRARPSFRRFSELTVSDINCDLHVHTKQTDGRADIASILKSAADRGIRRVGFTEHVRRSTDWFKDFARSVREAATASPQVDVYVGCESKALDAHGSLDASEEILADCDIVLGSVHRFPDGKGGHLEFGKLQPTEMMTTEFSLAMGLVDAAPIDVLAHPGGMYSRRHGKDFPPELLEALMRRGLERGIAIEINSSYLVRPDTFLEICAKIDPIVSIGSDMHDLESLGACRDLIMAWRENNV